MAISYGPMTGGEASVYSIYGMPPKYSMLMQNCHVSQRGGVEKIPGYVRCNDVSCETNLTSGYEFRTTNGVRRILAAGEGKIYEFNESKGSLVCIKDGLNQDAVVHFATFGDVCIITNGVDAPLKYDGVQVTSLGGNPPSTAFKAHVHKGRVWMIERNNTMLATCSALNDPEDYTGTTAGYIDFKYVLKSGDELVDVTTFNDLLLFFFRRHIAIYSGMTPAGDNADFQLVQLIEGCGAYDTDLIKGYASDVVFVYDTGFKSLRQVVTTGSLTVGEVSQIIAPTIQSEIASNAGNCAIVHYPAKSWLMTLINGKIWIYSYLWKAWGRMTGHKVYGMFDTIQGEVYLCGNGYLYRYGVGYSFDGEPIPMRWETAYAAFDKRGWSLGYPTHMELLLVPEAGGAINYCVKYDYDPEMIIGSGTASLPSKTHDIGVLDIDSVAKWDEIDKLSGEEYVAVSSLSRRLVPLFGGGRAAQITISNESVEGPLEINNLLIYAEIGIGGI